MTETSGGYDPDFYSKLYAAEDRHFWFHSRNRVIASMVSQVVEKLPPGYRILEVGCGNGTVTSCLAHFCGAGSVFGMDLFAQGLQYARKRGVKMLVQGDVAHPPFAKGFHLVGMFDVLEHIPDDAAALDQVRDLVDTNGALLITVPAYQTMWSYFDEAAHHCRRYEPADLTTRLHQGGFVLEYLTPFMMPLFPLMWLRRRLLRPSPGSVKQAASSELEVNGLLNGALRAVLAAERPLLAKRLRLPFGTSLIALARKRS